MRSLNCVLLGLLTMLLFTGCVSNGRFRLLNVDLRTPEQMVAARDEACIVYTSTISNTTNAPVVIQPAPKGFLDSFPFSLLFDLFKVAKGVFTVGELEWSSKKQ